MMSSNKAVSWKRFPIGELSQKRKSLKEDYLEADAKCVTLQNELSCVKKDINKVSKRIDRDKEKLAELNASEQLFSEKRQRLEPKTFSGFSKRKQTIRQMAPSKLCLENSEKLSTDIPVRSSQRRRKETIAAAKSIHGDSDQGNKAALDGLWVTLMNECSQQQLQTYLEASPKMQTIIPMVVKTQTKKYEDSHDNLVRSLKVLYGKRLLSKEKYKAVCRSIVPLTSAESSPLVTTTKLVYYDKLITFVKSVDIDNIKDFSIDFCQGLETFEDQVRGSYRDLCSYLLVLAELYILIDQELGSKSFIKNFGSLPVYHFRIALGADGAPFGKDEEATAWLVSFVNAALHIQSDSDNFIICGANCSESHIGMQRYAKKLVSEISLIEKQSYTVAGYLVRFSVELIPSDMKWISIMAGELNNAAYFFSPFGNVNEANKSTRNGSLGNDPACTWHPWDYEVRIKSAENVAKERETLSKCKLSDASKRSKLLNFIRGQNSRQEHEPLLGKLIDNGFAEPLHNSNNAWGNLHNIMLEIAVAKSHIPPSSTDINSLPIQCNFIRFLTVLKNTLRVTRLVKKLKHWFKEDRKKSFAYRFTGKETKQFCQQFAFLLQSLCDNIDPPELKQKISALNFCCIQLRDATAYFSRVMIKEDEVEKCKQACQYFFNIYSLMLRSVTPTVWTIGYAIPAHLKVLFYRYGMGLGINSMQGREAKHVRLSQFAKHTTKSNRWAMVLRHDFISNVWIRKQDPTYCSYTKHEHCYIPKEIVLDTFCYCGFPLDQQVKECAICSSPMYKAIARSAISGALENTLITQGY